MTNSLLEQYEAALRPQREQFEIQIKSLYENLTRLNSILFLLYFCSLGVKMTENVSDWIYRAGESCKYHGFIDLSEALAKHSLEEKGHELLMEKDTRSLAAFIEKKFFIHIDADIILNQPITPGVIQYRELHEDCILSNTPYGQIAIEYEIERVSVTQGPRFITHCLFEHGILLLKCLSFVRSHVSIDIHHTKQNKNMLKYFLYEHPQALQPLISYGKQALQSYGTYLNDCYCLAKHSFQIYAKNK